MCVRVSVCVCLTGWKKKTLCGPASGLLSRFLYVYVCSVCTGERMVWGVKSFKEGISFYECVLVCALLLDTVSQLLHTCQISEQLLVSPHHKSHTDFSACV